MSKHKRPRKRYYLWQLKRELQHRADLVTKWLKEQAQDLPDIIAQLKNK